MFREFTSRSSDAAGLEDSTLFRIKHTQTASGRGICKLGSIDCVPNTGEFLNLGKIREVNCVNLEDRVCHGRWQLLVKDEFDVCIQIVWQELLVVIINGQRLAVGVHEDHGNCNPEEWEADSSLSSSWLGGCSMGKSGECAGVVFKRRRCKKVAKHMGLCQEGLTKLVDQSL